MSLLSEFLCCEGIAGGARVDLHQDKAERDARSASQKDLRYNMLYYLSANI